MIHQHRENSNVHNSYQHTYFAQDLPTAMLQPPYPLTSQERMSQLYLNAITRPCAHICPHTSDSVTLIALGHITLPWHIHNILTGSYRHTECQLSLSLSFFHSVTFDCIIPPYHLPHMYHKRAWANGYITASWGPFQERSYFYAKGRSTTLQNR